MKLSKICEKIKYECLQGSMEAEVRDIIYDSRKIAKETMFVCMVGAVTDGHKYIPDAVEKGASVIVVERAEEAMNISDTITVLKVESARYALALMSAALFDYPAKKLITIGLTGTKGKTTTTYMIKNVLEAAGKKVGLIGTIGVMIGDEKIPSKNTTPESYELHRMFASMVEAGCEYAVMEVSSQGLKMDRTAGIMFDYGVFTNLSPDHIGPNEHASFEEYLECKSMLFRQCKIGILNADDEHSEAVAANHTCEIHSFGVEDNNEKTFLGKPLDLVAADLGFIKENGKLGMHFHVKGRMDCEARVHIPGRFSVFVTEIRPETNEVVLGENRDVFTYELDADHINFMSIPDIQDEMLLKAKIRYSHSGSMCKVTRTGEDTIHCEFLEPVRAVTPGQAVVLYDGEYVAGGGTIL